MNTELFGVFGDADAFERFRSPAEFDRVLRGDAITVGVRDVGLGIPTRTTTHGDDTGSCVLWGEVYPPAGAQARPAEWLLGRYAEVGTDALTGLNGSYLAVVDDGEDAVVATDPVRSWECYYTDAPGVRVFGTDPAAVARTIRHPTADPAAVLEQFHLGVVTGDRTVFEELRRTPFDGVLKSDGTRSLDRFVYRPREFDYADELARRLERALRRRARLPGRKGLLLSDGYDSRVVLAGVDAIEECYTVGPPGSPSVDVARRVAGQYDARHVTLPVDARYLRTDPDLVQYGQGIKESLHVHHAGYLDEMRVDTMLHGLLFDTILRGYFLPRDGCHVLGHTVPRRRLDPDPDPVAAVTEKFAVQPESRWLFPTCDSVDADTSEEFIRGVVERGLAAHTERYERSYDGIAAFGIENQPTTPFRTHLADAFLESFVAVDAELLDWHLSTPPEHRNTRTYLRAIRKLDPAILRHRPHDRPHNSRRLNEVERFLRRKLPGVAPFRRPWPDAACVYEARDLDDLLFADYPELHALPARLKLRINDVTTWMRLATERPDVSPPDVLCPPYASAEGVEDAVDQATR